MKIRYTLNNSIGYLEEARVYDALEDLGINNKQVYPSALYIIKRLKEEGFQAFIVGGAVRDLILNLFPKDFDIATDAHPHQIKIVFGKKAAIIGRRFRLVHVRISTQKFIEVVTFRTTRQKSLSNNRYGTIQEDVLRRDFSVNALFYDPLQEEVIDYVRAIESFQSKTIRPIIPCSIIFKEDPVRIIRMIKYSVKTSLRIPLQLRWQTFLDKKYLKKIPSARLTDELLKILQSGISLNTFKTLYKYKILKVICPLFHKKLKYESIKNLFWQELKNLDKKLIQSNEISKEDILKPFRKVCQIISKEEKTNLSDMLEKILLPIRFTGEWRMALHLIPPLFKIHNKNTKIIRKKKVKIAR